MPPAALAAPTDQYILALKRELEQTFKTQDEQIDRTREVRELARAVELPEKVVDVEVRDPDIAAEVGRRSAILNVNPPKLRVVPAKAGDASENAQANATLREEWTEAVLREAGRRVPGLEAYEADVDNCVGDGAGWLKLTFQNDLWDERYRIRQYPEDEQGQRIPKAKPLMSTPEYNRRTEGAKQNAGSPFVLTSVDPRTVYPVWSGIRLAEVLEVSKRPLLSCLREHRLTVQGGQIVPDETGRGMSDSEIKQLGQQRDVTFLEHWDEKYCTYMMVGVGGTNQAYQVQQWEHGYGQPPYFQAPGILFGYWTNRKVGWGVAEMKRWLVEYRAYLRTVLANVVAISTFTPQQAVGSDAAASLVGEDGKPKKGDKWGLREVTYLPPGNEIKEMPVRFDAQWLLKEIELVTVAIDELSSPRLPNQLGTGMEGAGFAIAQVIAEAKLADSPFCKHIARQLEDLTRFLWKLMTTKVKEPVWVQAGAGGGAKWLVLGPDDLSDGVGLEWEIDPERPTGKLIEGQYHQQQVQSEFESIDQAVEAQGRNPDEVRRGRDLDRMRKAPWYLQWKDKATAEKMGYGHLLQQAQEAAQVAAAPAVNPGVGAPANGAPPAAPQFIHPEGAVVPTQSAAPLAA